MRGAVLGAVFAALAAAGSSAALAPPEVTVVGAQFVPPALAVPRDTTVTFTSIEPFLHHIVVGDDGAFWGHLYPTNDPNAPHTFTHTLTAPSGAVLLYHCSLHATQHGAIIVT
jgi:plastocyanin